MSKEKNRAELFRTIKPEDLQGGISLSGCTVTYRHPFFNGERLVFHGMDGDIMYGFELDRARWRRPKEDGIGYSSYQGEVDKEELAVLVSIIEKRGSDVKFFGKE